MIILKNGNLRLDLRGPSSSFAGRLLHCRLSPPDFHELLSCFSEFSLCHFSQEVMRSDTTDQLSGSALAWSLWTGIQPSRLVSQN